MRNLKGGKKYKITSIYCMRIWVKKDMSPVRRNVFWNYE